MRIKEIYKFQIQNSDTFRASEIALAILFNICKTSCGKFLNTLIICDTTQRTVLSICAKITSRDDTASAIWLVIWLMLADT